MVVEPAQEIENHGRYSHILDLKPKKLPLLFLPGMKFMTKPTRIAFEKYIRDGGVAYFSFANDSWIIDWDKLAGVITDCKFGVPDFRATTHLSVRVEYDWGQFRKGEQISLPLLNNHPALSYCPIISTTARVIMTDQYGMPFLLENQVGRGKVYFTPYPLEALALKTSNDLVKVDIGRIYKSIDQLNVGQSEISIDGNGLEAGIWENQTKFRIIILNHSWQERSGMIKFAQPPGKLLSDLIVVNKEQECVYRLSLPRKGIAYLTIQKVVNSESTRTKEAK